VSKRGVRSKRDVAELHEGIHDTFRGDTTKTVNHSFDIKIQDGLAAGLAAKNLDPNAIAQSFERGPCSCGVVGCEHASNAAKVFVQGVIYGTMWGKAVASARAATPYAGVTRLELVAPPGGFPITIARDSSEVEIVRNEAGQVIGARTSG
jgi:hypothetical protein